MNTAFACLTPTSRLVAPTRKQGNAAFAAAVLLQGVRLGRLLRGRPSLQQVCEHAVSVLLPKLTAEDVVNQWRTAEHLLPSHQARLEARFLLAVGSNLLTRRAQHERVARL